MKKQTRCHYCGQTIEANQNAVTFERRDRECKAHEECKARAEKIFGHGVGKRNA